MKFNQIKKGLIVLVSMYVVVVFCNFFITDAFADAAKGDKSFKKFCAACHTVENGKNRVGPTLFAVVGRKAGTVPGFAYSPAMKQSGLTWDRNTLIEFLQKSSAV